MNINNILAVTRLELARKRKTFTTKSLILLLILFAVVISVVALALSIGLQPSIAYYSIQPTNSLLDPYFDDSSFVVDPVSPHQLVRTTSRTYLFHARRDIVATATQEALLELVQMRNYDALHGYAIDPHYLILLNISISAQEDRPPRPIRSIPGASTFDIRPTFDRSVDQPVFDDDFIDDSMPSTPSSQQPEQQTQPEQPFDTTPTNGEGRQDSTQPTGDGTPNGDIAPTDTRSLSVHDAPRLERIPAEDTDLVAPSHIHTFGFMGELLVIINIIIVLNLFSALWGTSVFEEKINQRSSLLFMSNITVSEFIIGKMLVYGFTAYLLGLGIIAYSNFSLLFHPVTHLIIICVMLIYFSLSCLNGLIARNHKEYSFLNVFSVSILSLYLLIPAFIANFSDLSALSPFTPLVLMLQGEPISVHLLLFIIIPALSISLIILSLAASCWDFELLYRHDSPAQKLLLMISTIIYKPVYLILFGILAVPVAWLGQLLLIAVFISIPFSYGFISFLFGAALIEELIRNLGLRSIITHPKEGMTRFITTKPFLAALLTGIGFGVAEKVTLALTIAPFLSGYEFLVLGGIIVPIMVHTVLSYLYIRVVSHFNFFRKHYFLLCILLALVHSLFNGFILSSFGGELI